MGRTPIPLQLIKGHLTNKEKKERAAKEKNINDKLRKDKIRPPTWLDAEAKKAFRQIVEQLKETEILTNLDVTALATYCDLHSRRLRLLADVRENGHTLTNTNSRGGTTYIQNPALTSLNSTIKLMQVYESKFGFTVFDRTKITLKDTIPDEKNEVEDMFNV